MIPTYLALLLFDDEFGLAFAPAVGGATLVGTWSSVLEITGSNYRSLEVMGTNQRTLEVTSSNKRSIDI